MSIMLDKLVGPAIGEYIYVEGMRHGLIVDANLCSTEPKIIHHLFPFVQSIVARSSTSIFAGEVCFSLGW
jgi:hypothetical protein